MDVTDVRLTVIVENTAHGKGLFAEHGLAVWIETPGGTVLWDTGQSGLVVRNASTLGIPLESAGHIVLSHGHYDHSGGLFDVLQKASRSAVYAHPGIFTPRFTPGGSVGQVRPIGVGFERGRLEASCGRLVESADPVEVIPGVFTTGEIPRVTSYEDTGGAFYLDETCNEPDPVADDQSLVIETDAGLVVVLGCCHAGIVNTLSHISGRWPGREILLVMGGMHLLNASGERMEKTIAALAEFPIRALSPGHCTGWKPVCMLDRAFPGRVAPLYTGWVWNGELEV